MRRALRGVCRGWLILRRFIGAVADGVVKRRRRQTTIVSSNIDSVLPLLVFFFPFLALLMVLT